MYTFLFEWLRVYVLVCVTLCMSVCDHVQVGLWTGVAVVAQSVASVCLWMTACCFSCADGRCM